MYIYTSFHNIFPISYLGKSQPILPKLSCLQHAQGFEPILEGQKTMTTNNTTRNELGHEGGWMKFGDFSVNPAVKMQPEACCGNFLFGAEEAKRGLQSSLMRLVFVVLRIFCEIVLEILLRGTNKIQNISLWENQPMYA